jgi:hypothetical protein
MNETESGATRSIRRLYRPPAEEKLTVSCALCGAIYAPSHLHQELRLASPSVLEAALMSMSHFCFRCRRAACPECWDHVHGICGACVEEVGLPFRRDPPPLEGALFPPRPLTQSDEEPPRESDPLLSCVQAGRFRAVAPPSSFIAAIETVETKQVSPSQLEAITPVPLRPTASEEDYRAEVAEIPTLPPPRLTAAGEHARDQQNATRPAPPEKSLAPARPLPPGNRRAGPSPRFSLRRSLSPVLLTLLAVVLTVVLLAELSPDLNALLVRLLHIDIRAAIDTFLQWVQWFH